MRGIEGSVGAMVLFLGVSGAIGGARTDDRPMEAFTRGVDAYMELRRETVAHVPPLVVSSDATAIKAASAGLAQAIAAARAGATAGDIFTPDVTAAFQARIAGALRQHRYAPAQVLRDLESEAPDAPATLTVNGRFDWRYGAMMPVCVLEALPALPAGLEFRFVGRDLVLVDIDAALIVDVLPVAFEVNSL